MIRKFHLDSSPPILLYTCAGRPPSQAKQDSYSGKRKQRIPKYTQTVSFSQYKKPVLLPLPRLIQLLQTSSLKRTIYQNLSKSNPNHFNMSSIRFPTDFLSLSPVASPSNVKQNSTQLPIEESNAETAKPTILRTSSDASVASDSGKQMRFLKLGHHDGDWSEEVIEG